MFVCAPLSPTSNAHQAATFAALAARSPASQQIKPGKDPPCLAVTRLRIRIAPAHTGRMFTAPVPALRMPDESMDPEAAYRFIHDELMLDGSCG